MSSAGINTLRAWNTIRVPAIYAALAASFAEGQAFCVPFEMPARLRDYLIEDGYHQVSADVQLWRRSHSQVGAVLNLGDAPALRRRFTAIVAVLAEASPQFCGLAQQLLAEYAL